LIVALVPAFNEEGYVASVLVRLMRVVDGVIVCYAPRNLIYVSIKN
jgi:hypothetical protein